MKKTKIFIEASSIAEQRVSGIGHMTSELVRALDRHPDNGKSFEIVLVICSDRAQYLEQWNFNNVKVKRLLFPQRVFNILWKFDLLPPIDVICGHGAYIFPNYKNWRLISSSSFTFVCDVSYLVVPQFVSPKNQKFLEKNISKWTKRATKVLAISQSAKEEIIQYLKIPKDKLALIYCGIDPSVFYPRTKNEVENVKEKYRLPQKYILFLSNIEPRKNVLNLLEAYKKLPKHLRDEYALLLIGGGGWLNEPILAAIDEAVQEGYNVVRPSRYIPDSDLPALHTGAELLVHPAYYEGFGIAPLQAMACGTPVVVANNSSLIEVVGNAGLLVDANDANDISVKIKELLENSELRMSLIDEGMTQSTKYTWEQSAKDLIREVQI